MSMNVEQLQAVRKQAEVSLAELVDLLNHAPGLASQIRPLIQANDILTSFQLLADSNAELAEQLLRMALATTVNYHTLVETAQQIARHGNQ